MERNSESILFCVSGPTASGKSSICKKICEVDKSIYLSISTTTRKPRVGEIDGVDYFFVSKEEFEKKISAGDFIEHAEYSGNYYGTDKNKINQAIDQGLDVIFEIEVQGVAQLKKIYGEKVVTVFVFPPSFKILKDRLLKRATDDEEQILKRLEIARSEIVQLKSPDFSDYLVINDNLTLATGLLRNIVDVERSAISRQKASYLKDLLAE
jgi:guanylate kinase